MSMIRYPIDESSHIGKIRRRTEEMAKEAGFDDSETGKLSIIINEAGSNVLKHAKKGEMIVNPLKKNNVSGLEILAIDCEKGIANIQKAISDGHSTAGSRGCGLGAISRLSDFMDIYSVPGQGTVLYSQSWSKPRPSLYETNNDKIGAVCLPKSGEKHNGDGWAFRRGKQRLYLMVADGLGHGFSAEEASRQACEKFYELGNTTPESLITDIHDAIRGTRGAAVAVAEIDINNDQIHYAGIGNISGTIVSRDQRKSLVSRSGIVGYSFRKIQKYSYAFPKDTLLILHSDGLSAKWDMADYPGLKNHHPVLIAAVLYRDFRRSRDDVTIAVVKNKFGDT